MKSLHNLLDDGQGLSNLVHDSVSYGHSNGWIQTKADLIKDAGIKTDYHSFKEDSVDVVVTGTVAYIRFVADIDVTWAGKRNMFHLKVLEVWVRDNDKWKLLARQALK